MIDDVVKNKCNGCYACYNICPVDAITMTPDSEGFSYPLIDYNKCIKCEKCSMVCTAKNSMKRDNRDIPNVYACWSSDEEIRIGSTSGGVFSELAMQVLKNSGYVCGAIYNEEHMVEHYLSCNMDDLDKIRQSKYVQSAIHTIYRQIADLLEDNKLVLFCGTPCECAGLYQYLKCLETNQSKLILIDFVCRGSNSPKVYRMFLDQLEAEYGAKVKRVWFKNKTYGWNRFSTKIEFENGESYLHDRNSDQYIRGYIEANLYMRPCCGDCDFKGFPRISDITLGDFWGIELKDKSKTTDKGTSLVMINSPKGEDLFYAIKENIFYEEKELSDASKGNPCMYQSIVHGPNRENFMRELDQRNINENIGRFLTDRK